MKLQYMAYCALTAAGLILMAEPATARQADESAEAIDEIIVTVGTRTRGRILTDSPVPVDVVSGDDLESRANSDLSDAVSTLVPSFVVQRFPIADGSAFVRPATLRGLTPDQALVLVNGKRRHRAALVQFSGGTLSQGSQGPDLAMIPSIAVDSLEVLRDGAAAQYGSDAIAGVMNFRLKDNTDGGTVVAKYGQAYEGDGEESYLGVNYGFGLTDSGFLNLSLEYSDSGRTSRGIQRPDAQAAIDAGVPNSEFIQVPAQIWGNPDVQALRTFWNAEIDVDDNTWLYFFGNFADVESEGSFFYRAPPAVAAVGFSSAGLFQVLTLPGGGTFSFEEFFPGGFDPIFGADISDVSTVIGARGESASGLIWDVSGSFGENEINYRISDTVNPSLGPASPTSFRPGTLIQTEQNINFDAAYPFEPDGLAGPLVLGFGAELRREEYTIEAGDPQSFEVGPFVDVGQAVGSNGFQGFSPATAGEFDNESVAFYVDAEIPFSDRFFLQLAARFENFEDFGSTSNGKIAARFDVTDTVGLRAAVSTGFRAPTPGQASASSLGTDFDPGIGSAIIRGFFPATDPAAQFFGATPLDPEESTNISAGITFNPSNRSSLTIDYFFIELEDRIGLSSNFTVDAAAAAALEALGVVGANTIGSVAYFANDFTTETSGIDIVGTTQFDWGSGTTDLSVAVNYTKTEVIDANTRGIDILSTERIGDLEDQLPNWRGVITLSHAVNNLNLLARARYYGDWTNHFGGGASEDFGAEILFDLEASYAFNNSVTVTLGLENAFDAFPDAGQAERAVGIFYPIESPFGFNGGSYYLRFTADF